MSIGATNTVGFRCWNDFHKEIRHLQQLYDFTAHLYTQEHLNLALLRKKAQSIRTTIGTITHDVNRLYGYTRDNYPNKLRELIIVSAVTSLEVFLSDLVYEISGRTLEPFMSQSVIELHKAQILCYPSIDVFQDEIINGEVRQLTSGGLLEISKYYQAKFNIDLKSLKPGLYEKVLEIHERRHLYVHRNGLCDAQYVRKYPDCGFELDQRINSSQEYLIASLNTLKEFAALIKNLALEKYPFSKRKRLTVKGNLPSPVFENPPMMIRIEIKKRGYDPLVELPKISMKIWPPNLPPSEHCLGDFTHHIIQEESALFLIVSGNPLEIKAIMRALKQADEILVRSMSQVFG
jgi:hypothetical protein